MPYNVQCTPNAANRQPWGHSVLQRMHTYLPPLYIHSALVMTTSSAAYLAVQQPLSLISVSQLHHAFGLSNRFANSLSNCILCVAICTKPVMLQVTSLYSRIHPCLLSTSGGVLQRHTVVYLPVQLPLLTPLPSPLQKVPQQVGSASQASVWGRAKLHDSTRHRLKTHFNSSVRCLGIK